MYIRTAEGLASDSGAGHHTNPDIVRRVLCTVSSNCLEGENDWPPTPCEASDSLEVCMLPWNDGYAVVKLVVEDRRSPGVEWQLLSELRREVADRRRCSNPQMSGVLVIVERCAPAQLAGGPLGSLAQAFVNSVPGRVSVVRIPATSLRAYASQQGIAQTPRRGD